MTTLFSVAPEIVAHAAYFTEEPIASIVRITDGSINDTYEVKTQSGEVFILQKMSTLFKPSVMDNLMAVAPYTALAGVKIPEAIRTRSGDLFVAGSNGSWYRALSFIDGQTIHKDISVYSAKSAGQLVGKFHSALTKCDAPLVEAIAHFHDTPFYFERMSVAARENSDEMKRATLMPIMEEIERRTKELTVQASDLPQRVIHADLKVSNIRFNEAGDAVGLIDMDTLMRASVVVEMGDALRSLCGTAGEDSAEQVFDSAICTATLAGYTETAVGITDEEIKAIPEGIRILTLELASRFVTDAFEEKYFAQSSHYPSLYEQCKTKAENQLLFLQAFEAKRHLL